LGLNRLGAFIFAKPCFNDRISNPSRAIQETLIEFTFLQQEFKFTWPRRIEMRAQPIDGDRKGRDAVGSQAIGSEKPIFDLHNWDLSSL
jgi:hypothetical protein